MKYFVSGDIHGFYDDYRDKTNFESFITPKYNIPSHLHDIHKLNKLVQDILISSKTPKRQQNRQYI